MLPSAPSAVLFASAKTTCLPSRVSVRRVCRISSARFPTSDLLSARSNLLHLLLSTFYLLNTAYASPREESNIEPPEAPAHRALALFGTLTRSSRGDHDHGSQGKRTASVCREARVDQQADRKSTRLNSSHSS